MIILVFLILVVLVAGPLGLFAVGGLFAWFFHDILTSPIFWIAVVIMVPVQIKVAMDKRNAQK